MKPTIHSLRRLPGRSLRSLRALSASALLLAAMAGAAQQASAAPILRITEALSSGDTADWFEVTNYGDTAADITGYHVDDSSYAVATAFPLNGVTSIAPGESVVFIEGTATTATTMKSNWGLGVAAQVGYYSGAAIGLSGTADGVTLFNNSSANSGTELTGPFGGLIRVSFALATSGSSFNWSYDATGASTSSPTGQITTGTATWTNVAVPMIGTPTVPTPAAPASAVSLAAASIAEGNSGTVTLNVPVSRNVTYTDFTVDYAVTGGTATAGTDYATLASGTLTFAANGSASQNIAITINGDTVIESNETITLTLSNVVNTGGTTVIGTASASGTITNDDAVALAYPPTNAITTTVKSNILLGGSEIPAFDAVSKRAFATSNVGIQVVDLTTPATPVQLTTITPATLGVSGVTSNDVSSIAVRKGSGANPSVLAACIISSPKTAVGYVIFLNAADGSLLGSVAVGANPDHVSWTPDGTKLLVANEGEVDGAAADVATDATLGTVSIINVAAGFASPVVTTANFTAYDSQVATLRAAGVRIFKNASGTDAVPSMDFEPEYIAISADSTSAMVTLQEANAVATLNIATATFTSVKALGKKDFSTLRADFSDRDGAGATALVNPTTGSPVFGLYMPDAIGSYTSGGQTYYVTANEGDDRNDFLTPDETTTVSNAGYDLDDTLFPNEAALKNNAALGRLTVVNSLGNRGDTDGDGDIDEIQMLGARSFSILDAAGNRVFDSGDMIEMIVASQHIANFDDTRSDNKGGEPEGVAMATFGGRTYAFIGLERHHMGLVFDVTNPAAVTYTTSFKRTGDLNPEGMVVVSAADSPTGKPLLLMSSEVSNTLTVFEIDGAPAADYTLQLLHYYGESGLLGIQTAPIMGAMIDKFDSDYANTLVLGEGDSFIPGPWLIGGADPSLNAVAGIGTTSLGRPDIAIMNAFGTSASALGNHEFDLGSPVLASALIASGSVGTPTYWPGAQFPLVTTNLDFTGDSSLKARADTTLGGTGGSIAGLEVTALKAKIAPYAIKTINGQKVGIVGSTTWDLASKTSPNGTIVKDDANAATSDLQEVAAYVQAAVNALIAQGVNKVIMVDQLDVLQRNKDLAGLVSGIDVMVAGGGHERMGDATDTAVGFNGHDANFIADAYPIVTAGADSKPVLIVTTDTEYSYLGRLVVDFDANGELIVANLNTSINGAYASTEANLQSVYGSAASAATLIAASPMATSVKAITDAINAVVTAKDSTVYGYTNVYLEGDRVFGRTQEVNLGNITADANAAAAKTALGLPATAAVFSLKNGGGIRASLGSVLADGTKIAPIANPITGKPANGISQLDVENALRFDNKMMTCEMTPAGLLNVLNFAAGLSSGPSAQSGGYPQVGNIRFSYDYSNTAARVRTAVMVNDNGDIVARLVENGVVRADAPALVRAVILNFTANGGDGYPIKANADNFRYVLNNGTLSGIIDESLDFTSAANVPVNAYGEQAIFAAYLTAKHGSVGTAYNTADTEVALDTRIQQLAGGIRTDTVNDGSVFMVTPAFTTSPVSQSIALGSSVTLTVAVTGSPEPTLQWYLGTAGDTTNPIANATSTSFTTPVLVADASYWVRATSQAGTADSSTATISVSYSSAFSSTSRSVTRQNTAAWSPSGVTVNGTTFVNLGLQGVGRVPANSIDAATGESLGSVSDMQITGWKKNANGTYTGTLQTLPDRGYNSGTVYSNYAARINAFTFTFTPYTSSSPTTAQNQIALSFAGSSRFTYDDGTGQKYTTGLLANAVTTLSGVPYPAASVATTQADGTVANRLTIDSEGLVLDNRAGKSGAGWVSDEYGPYIYHFNAAKQIDGQLQLPAALIPHKPVGTTSFVDTNNNGRRTNQGMEGLAQSPDGTKLYALLQSATLQDSLSGNQGRYNTRLLVYDISGSDLPSDPVAQYVIQLPVADDTGLGGAPNRNLAQSAILALNDHQLLILSRDGNGRGVPTSAAPVFKSILLADLNGASNIDGTYDAEGNTILASGALNAAITPLAWSEALNLIGKLGTSSIAEVAKFGLNLSAGNGDSNSICEKWEALALVSANDVANPNDYFLFVGNDNDFASATGKYMAADGTLQSYDSGLENDTIVMAYRVRMTGTDNQRPFVANTIADQSANTGSAFSLAFAADTFADPESGTLTYTATKGDDTALPAWLTFNAATRTFSGTPAVGDIGSLVVKVTATDNGAPALFTSTTFTITINLPPTFAFSASTASVREDAGKVTLTINRTGDPVTATVNVTTNNGTGTAGTDYTALSSFPVVFAASQTSKTVDVLVTNRPGIRASRTFTAVLADAATAAPATTTVTITEAESVAAVAGPSSSASPYVLPMDNNWQTRSLLTVGDSVGGYQMAGIPDGLGAYDNNDGTITLLMNHELGSTLGVVRAHGAIGSFISEWVINKTTLAVVSGSDLVRNVFNWNATTQASDTLTSTLAFNRFCSADLPAQSAFYNAATGLGTTTRLFMAGEEGGANGWAAGHVASGPNKGRSYILGKFNLSTNGSGLIGVGAWETLCANPVPQDKTIVIGNNDGGTGIMANSVAVYVGTKTNSGSEVEKAGLTNGTLKFINVAGNALEIPVANATTRVTNITSGTAFSLSATASTTFSRPEDGAWDPSNPSRFYFVTTDRLDQVNDGIGAQVGRTRLWRLNFTDIANPDAGGTIDLVINGGVGNDASMWDNLTVTSDGKLMLQEDVGGAPRNGKVWFFDPITNVLTKVLKHDAARFGDIVSGVAVPATAPFTNDEETSGIIDVTAMFGGNAASGNSTYIMVDQAHYTTGISTANVEGGQLLLVQQTSGNSGPSTTTTPYVQAIDPTIQVSSILTVGDSVGGYQMAGLPDGLGAYDNGDGTLTLLMHHEISNTLGVARAHGGIGAFVSEWVINKSTLAVVSGSDLMRNVYNWNATTQASDSSTSTLNFNRFCSADLPEPSALYNAATGLGSRARIFMGGEESGSTGWAMAHVASGVDKGNSYVLGKFNLSTNGSGLTGVGGWETLCANPVPQDKTIVIGNNDGGTGIMANTVAVYVGTKTNTGTEADKAGLTNGTLKFVNVAGNALEIPVANATTRVTNITSGTAFSLSATASTTFSRPEDGAWDPSNPSRFYFVTTDRLDSINDGVGTQVGRTRLWRLNFTDIANPDAGGTIDLVINGGVGNDANMWDNITVTSDGKLMLQEDVGGTAHNGKVWFYDPITNVMTKVLKHDASRFGDIVSGVAVTATAPFTNDEETSGIIDVSSIFGSNAAAGQRTYLLVDQAHYNTGISAANVEGGQLLLMRQTPAAAFSLAAASASVLETAGNLPVVINRFGDLQYAASVTLNTADGTALSGTDFTGIANQLVSFAPGEASKSINLAITNRPNGQVDRSLTVALSSPAAVGVSAVLGNIPSTTVTISDTLTAPSDITLSASELIEHNLANATVGTLAAVDPNAGETHTFSLVSGAGSSDNASFTIAGDVLKLTPVANAVTKASYNIRIRATDSSSAVLSFEKAFTITILPQGSVAFDVADITVNQGSTSVTLNLTRSGGSVATSVLLSTANGTATAGTDYTAISAQTISFATGINTATATITLSGASIVSSRSFTATLSSSATGASIGLVPTVAVRIKADSTVPVVAITAPTAGQVIAEVPAGVTVTGSLGTAGAGDASISSVTVSVNGGTPVNATISGDKKTFSLAGVQPAGGLTSIVVTATDVDGNVTVSPATSFTYTVQRPLVITATNGKVAISPALVAGKAFVGTTYTVTATPNLGYVFGTWSGKPTGNVATTSFVFATGDSVTANFNVSPFTTSIAGFYNGVIKGSTNDTDTQANSGLITLTVLKNTGAFTGKVILDGITSPLDGVFNGVTGTATLGSSTNGLRYDLSVSLASATPVVSGTISKLRNGTAVAVLNFNAPKCYASGKLTAPAATMVAAYNIAMGITTVPSGLTASDYPAGYSVATLAVTSSGTATFVATLADGTVLTSARSLCLDNTLPIYANYLNRSGAICGTALIDTSVLATDVTGNNLKWFLSESTRQFYPVGFGSKGLTLTLAGTKQSTSNLASLRLGTGSPNATLTLEGSTLPATVIKSLKVTTKGAGAPALLTDKTTKLTISAATGKVGVITGSYQPTLIGTAKPKVSETYLINGVILGKGSVSDVYGHFRSPTPTLMDGSGQAGLLTLDPIP